MFLFVSLSVSLTLSSISCSSHFSLLSAGIGGMSCHACLAWLLHGKDELLQYYLAGAGEDLGSQGWGFPGAHINVLSVYC